jgi:hypothetical protein
VSESLRPTRSSRRSTTLLVIATVLIVFARVASHDFLIWDDRYTIQRNARLHPPTLQSIVHYWTHPEFGLYIPVTYTTWAAIAPIARVDAADPTTIAYLSPRAFHTANLVLHMLSALVVLAILRRLTANDWAACAGALLFALHPVQVEPVAWASGLKDVLAGLLALSAVWFHLRDQRRSDIVALIAFILAMLAKPQALVTPLIVLVIDVWILGRTWRTSIRTLWPWLLLMVACAITTKLIQDAPMVADCPLWSRPLIAGDAVAFYLQKLVVPWPLIPDYGRTPAQVIERGWVYWTPLIPLALIVLLWIFRNRVRWLIASFLIFIVGVLPVLGLTRFLFQQYSTVADHYLYLSMLGPAIAVAWLLNRYRAQWLVGACAVWLCVLGAMSFVQTGRWENDVTLFTYATSVNPQSFVSHNNLGAVLLESGRLDEARAHLSVALAIKPDYAPARDNLNALVEFEKRLQNPR